LRAGIAASPPMRTSVLLIDEVLLAIDVEGLVPRAVNVEHPGGQGLDGAFALVSFDEVKVVGSVAKGVSYEGLLFGTQDGRWRCQAIVDV